MIKQHIKDLSGSVFGMVVMLLYFLTILLIVVYLVVIPVGILIALTDTFLLVLAAISIFILGNSRDSTLYYDWNKWIMGTEIQKLKDSSTELPDIDIKLSPKILSDIAAHYNKDLPKEEGAETIWLSSSSWELTITNQYKLVNMKADDIPYVAKKLIQKGITNTMCKEEKGVAKYLIDSGATIKDTYVGKNDSHVMSFSVDANACNEIK
jgi:hypothetical protein